MRGRCEKSGGALAVIGLLCLAGSAAAQTALPTMKVEPIGGGTAFTVKNSGSAPLTAYMIELVGYPGSSYALIQDDIVSPVAAGKEERVPVNNMIPGAAPDYVKLEAAIWGDGSSSGSPEKIKQIIDHRRLMLETTRGAIERLKKARQSGASKDALLAEFKKWNESIPEPVHKYRFRPKELNDGDQKAMISDVTTKLQTEPVDGVLAGLENTERALAASKPAL